jgi:hypothetical protein
MAHICDTQDCLQVSATCIVGYLILFVGGHYLFWPTLFPKTYARLAKEPGKQPYFDSSCASFTNTYLAVLAVMAFMRTPDLLTSPNGYLKNTDTCRLVTLFLSWNVFDLCHLLIFQWRHNAQWMMLVHHVSAVAAWVLYLEGGYGHALSLVGLCCEFTNPCMNLRYFLDDEVFGLKKSKWYLYNGMAFVLVWLLVRILFAIPVGSYVIFNQWESLAAIPLWRRLCFAGFFGVGCLLNLSWGYKLFRGAYKVLKGKAGAQKKAA